MLSAIEQIGPVTGPSTAAAAVLPYAYHHNTYAIVTNPQIGSTKDIEEFRAHKLLNQQQQRQQQQQQQPHPHQQHISLLGTPPSIANLTLLSPPLSSPSSSASTKSLQHVELNSLPVSYVRQQTDTSPISVQSLSLSHQQDISSTKTIMSGNEFARPRQNASTISIHPLPLQPNNLGIGLRNGYCSPSAYSAQHCSSYSSPNDQSAPINLVTTSNVFPSSPYQVRRSPSSCSSVDVENDDSMSPVTIQTQPHLPTQQQTNSRKAIEQINVHKPAFDQVNSHDHSNSTTAVSMTATNYPLDYSHLYASRAAAAAALYGTPIFSTHHVAALRSHAPYLGALPAQHPTAQPSDLNTFAFTCLKVIQNAAAKGGIYNSPEQTLPQPMVAPGTLNAPQVPSPSACTKPGMRAPADPTALAPSTGPTIICHNFSNNATAQNDLHYKIPTDIKKFPDVSVVAPNNIVSNKLPSGTYLNNKVRTSPADTSAEIFFKVPSGKEGSLKHRILTRPTNADKSSSDMTKSAVMRTHNSTSNFRRGSYIELSKGVFRKVEDMRTEDFIKCAERSLHHQLIESTVVKINTATATVLITFSYNKNKSRADIEVTAEHPFFVYGQGWASCNPEMSLKAYGLKCQRLQVGDICISLSKRENASMINDAYAADVERRQQHQSTTTGGFTNRDQMPSIAKRDLRPEGSAMPTTVVGGHFNVPLSQYHNLHNMPVHLLPPPPHLVPHSTMYADVTDLMVTGAPLQAQHLHLSPAASMHGTQHYFEMRAPSQSSRNELQQSRTASTDDTNIDRCDDQEQPVDASLASASRKRRWSAPESICDSDDNIPLIECSQPVKFSAEASTSTNNCKMFTKAAKRPIGSKEKLTA